MRWASSRRRTMCSAIAAARERGEMIWLEHGESRSYDAVFRVLDGGGAIAEAARRIAAIAQQPDETSLRPRDSFPPLGEGPDHAATSVGAGAWRFARTTPGQRGR